MLFSVTPQCLSCHSATNPKGSCTQVIQNAHNMSVGNVAALSALSWEVGTCLLPACRSCNPGFHAAATAAAVGLCGGAAGQLPDVLPLRESDGDASGGCAISGHCEQRGGDEPAGLGKCHAPAYLPSRGCRRSSDGTC